MQRPEPSGHVIAALRSAKEKIKALLRSEDDETFYPIGRAARRKAGNYRGATKGSLAQRRKAPNRLKTHTAVNLPGFGPLFIPNERVEELTDGQYRPVSLDRNET